MDEKFLQASHIWKAALREHAIAKKGKVSVIGGEKFRHREGQKQKIACLDFGVQKKRYVSILSIYSRKFDKIPIVLRCTL